MLEVDGGDLIDCQDRSPDSVPTPRVASALGFLRRLITLDIFNQSTTRLTNVNAYLSWLHQWILPQALESIARVNALRLRQAALQQIVSSVLAICCRIPSPSRSTRPALLQDSLLSCAETKSIIRGRTKRIIPQQRGIQLKVPCAS